MLFFIGMGFSVSVVKVIDGKSNGFEMIFSLLINDQADELATKPTVSGTKPTTKPTGPSQRGQPRMALS